MHSRMLVRLPRRVTGDAPGVRQQRCRPRGVGTGSSEHANTVAIICRRLLARASAPPAPPSLRSRTVKVPVLPGAKRLLWRALSCAAPQTAQPQWSDGDALPKRTHHAFCARQRQQQRRCGSREARACAAQLTAD
jgi:hypothetical protein